MMKINCIPAKTSTPMKIYRVPWETGEIIFFFLCLTLYKYLNCLLMYFPPAEPEQWEGNDSSFSQGFWAGKGGIDHLMWWYYA